MERIHSDRNAWTFLASTDTKAELKIVMQQPQERPYFYHPISQKPEKSHNF
jgi:hypothetical protein